MALLLWKLSCVLMPYLCLFTSHLLELDSSCIFRWATFTVSAVNIDDLYRNDYVYALWASKHVADVLLHTYIHTYIYNYSDFLVVLISVGFAQARPNYIIKHTFYTRNLTTRYVLESQDHISCESTFVLSYSRASAVNSYAANIRNTHLTNELKVIILHGTLHRLWQLLLQPTYSFDDEYQKMYKGIQVQYQ